jgi:transposase-like protein
VLSLIRSHAILHQASRERDANGKVIATLEDYAIVRELVVDLVSESVEATVPPTVRETVKAVAALAGEEGVSISALARALNLDKASASRRWQSARGRGYLKNLETRRGKPARIVLADPLPDDVEILPSVEALTVDRWSGAVDPEEGQPLPRSPRPEQTTHQPLMIGDPGYLLQLDAAYAAGWITRAELSERIRSATLYHRAQNLRSSREQCD